MREHPRVRPLAPILVFSPAVGASELRKALEAGATRRILKPDPDGLSEAMRDFASEVASGAESAASARQ